MSERVRIEDVTVLADDWATLKKTTFDFRRSDGTWQRQSRETYDRGNGAVILLYNRVRRTVVLTRQFRFPVYVNGGGDGFLIEAPAGLLDMAGPEERIRREVAEETGYEIGAVERLWDVFMSPGSVTERLFFFIAPYTAGDRTASGGGDREEGEDIEVLETLFAEAMAMIADGTIRDAKTIMLLQHVALTVFAAAPMPA